MVRFTILGSGTSSGIPTISCLCPTCTSDDPKDRRLRTSLLIESDTTTIVIDSTPDFRQQMLHHNIKKLDAIIYTHSHFDHIGGFDDIRAYNWTMHSPIKIYLNQTTLDKIQRTFFYAFEEPEQMGGGVPVVDINMIDSEPFVIGDIDIQPILLKHGLLDVLGFRIGDFAYCTDTNFIPDSSIAMLSGLDYLIIDALHYKYHPTHFCVDDAISIIDKLQPRYKSYLIHIAHQIKHSVCEEKLPDNIRIAFDGLAIQT